jgi:multidrug efflux system membrane fusion protein
VGLRLVDPGNLVIANTTQTLVINQFEPIAVFFTLPEDQLQRVLTGLRAKRQLPAEAFDRSDTHDLESGLLMAVDNQIDTTTGTDRLKAVFSNKEQLLFPNQFVNVHLIIEQRPNAIVMPAAALQHGTDGDYVWLVKPDKTAAMQPVKVSTVEGTAVVLDSGLSAGQQIVIDGADKLREGSKVIPSTGHGGRPGGQHPGQQKPGQQKTGAA